MSAGKPGEKKLDRRVIRTRRAIMNAFDRLVLNNPLDKITVSAIAREAGIDRKTFYLHYSSIDDLTTYKTEMMLERIIDAVKTECAGVTFMGLIHLTLCEINTVLNENLPLYSSLATRLSTDQVLEHFENAVEPALAHAGVNPAITQDQQVRMMSQFYVAGALSLYTSWLRSDHSQPVETVSSAIEDAIAAIYNAHQCPETTCQRVTEPTGVSRD